MNVIELKNTLYNMIKNCNQYTSGVCEGITNTIINHYMVEADYYEENAINTMNNFIKHNVLVF